MPELPEVEIVRRTLEPHLVGQRFLRVLVREARLRTPVDEASLSTAVPNRRIKLIRRRGKYLLIDLDGGLCLMVHLGMSGRLTVVPAARPLLAHDHVLWDLPRGRQLRFNDPRRFGLIEVFASDAEATHRRLSMLGLEPLEPTFSSTRLLELTRTSRKPIKNFLMDSSRVVGIGNIYACESLFLAGIHPATPASSLSRDDAVVLVSAIKRVLRKAILRGGTTLRDFNNADGEIGHFAAHLFVYGRDGEQCEACGRTIGRMLQSGRSTFFCSHCQSRSR